MYFNRKNSAYDASIAELIRIAKLSVVTASK